MDSKLTGPPAVLCCPATGTPVTAVTTAGATGLGMAGQESVGCKLIPCGLQADLREPTGPTCPKLKNPLGFA